MKERDNSVDVAKGFGILLVLLGHLSIMWTNPDFKYIFHAIYSFHMPMFVILSGYFFHSRGRVVDNVYSSFKTLAVPYLKTGLFCLVFSYTFYDDTFTKQLLYGLFIGNCGNVFSYYTTFPLQGGPMWFLLSLFWCRVTYDIISRRTSRKITGVLSFVIFLGAYVIGAKIVTIPLGFGAGLTMLPFYFIGHLLREYPQKKVFVLYMIPIWLYAVATSYLNMAQFLYGHTPVAFMGGGKWYSRNMECL